MQIICNLQNIIAGLRVITTVTKEHGAKDRNNFSTLVIVTYSIFTHQKSTYLFRVSAFYI